MKFSSKAKVPSFLDMRNIDGCVWADKCEKGVNFDLKIDKERNQLQSEKGSIYVSEFGSDFN